jgi:hypothetical protein
MTSLPVNVVNLICEWAANDEQEWIPFFCPRTHNLSYKFNKACKKFIEKGDIILHNKLDSYVIEGRVVINFLHGESHNINFKGILFQYGKKEFKIYMESDSEHNESQKGKHIYRAMISFTGDYVGGTMNHYYRYLPDLYLNGTQYGSVLDAYYEHNTVNLWFNVEKF